MSTTPARRGRPSKASNAEMELVALRGAIKRFIWSATPVQRREFLRGSWASGASQDDALMRAEMTRLAKAAMSPTDL